MKSARSKEVRFLYLILLVVSGLGTTHAQESFPFDVELVQVDIPDLPGLHSYAFGQADGMWLLVGGRLDGLHARQPTRSFPVSENNSDLYVVDPERRTVWTASALSLPTKLAEQMQSTNMNFCQDGTMLYVIGGYGYSETARDYVTYPYFTAIDVAGAITAIRRGAPIAPYFRQIEGSEFAVTGGQLGKIGNEFFLVGGQRFDGRYNPMGGMSYRQQYTNEIRVFSIENDEVSLRVDQLRTYYDSDHLHRRDYNLVPQRFPDGTEGYMISAGVFRADADLPFLYPVDITEHGFVPHEEFEQLLSHYHSAKLALYDANTGEMHSIFFGGMAQYYYAGDELARDDQVPFVDTISRVTRNSDGSFAEHVLPGRMPGLLGASGEFIPNPDLLPAGSKVFRTNDLSDGPAVVGHIVGGIQSPTPNPFFINRTDLTAAASSVYAVQLTRRQVAHTSVVGP